MANKFFTMLFIMTVLVFTSCSSDDDGPGTDPVIIEEGDIVNVEVGGPNQPDQVYVDLSTNTSTKVQRDSWDLGFYSGPEFRVVLNGSVSMAAATLSGTDIDAVDSEDPEILDGELLELAATNTYTDESTPFVDTPDGKISGTAVARISENDTDNKVHLVNLGFEVGTDDAPTGSVSINGDHRGWMKIRILRDGDSYVLQYAALDDTTHKEVVISKKEGYNFTFFSFTAESEVDVEPETTAWDLNFTVFTNLIDGFGPYVYSDFVIHNTKGNVGVYEIDTEENTGVSYDDFTLENVNNNNFVYDNQTVIGGDWRNGGGPGTQPSIKENIFYVIKDTDGNLYKVQFLAMFDSDGNRGYPQFVYSLLQ